MKKITTVETALKVSYPGYFEISVGEMDEYVRQLSPDPMEFESHSAVYEDNTGDIIDVQLATQPASFSPVANVNATVHSVTSPLTTGTLNLSQVPTLSLEADRRAPAYPHDSPTKISRPASDDTSVPDGVDAVKPSPRATNSPSRDSKIPSKVKNVLRVEVRWAPKDFSILKASRALLFTRFAPILSRFNTTHSWVIGWQTDEMSKTSIIEPTQVDKFLSVRFVASVKHKCFFLVSDSTPRVLNLFKFSAPKKSKQSRKEKASRSIPRSFPILKAKLHMWEIFY